MDKRRLGWADAPARERKISPESDIDDRVWVYETDEYYLRIEGRALRRAMAQGVLFEKDAEGAGIRNAGRELS